GRCLDGADEAADVEPSAHPAAVAHALLASELVLIGVREEFSITKKRLPSGPATLTKLRSRHVMENPVWWLPEQTTSPSDSKCLAKLHAFRKKVRLVQDMPTAGINRNEKLSGA